MGKIQTAYPVAKRFIDILGALVCLIVLLPVLVAVAIAVWLTSEGPALFWSNRVGHNGKVFPMPKFRTMTCDSKVVSREIASSADIKFTPIGMFLRKCSLDELPQIWSVLRGDMSFIGPRPLIVNDYANATRATKPEIYKVKPGMTGLAQVNGRNFITPRNKVRYDAFYSRNMCVILDLKIAFKTLGVVINPKLVQ